MTHFSQRNTLPHSDYLIMAKIEGSGDPLSAKVIMAKIEGSGDPLFAKEYFTS